MTQPQKPVQNKPTNTRENRRRQERSLLYLTVFVLVVVGTGLIGLIWGGRAAFLGAIFLVGGAVLIGGIWLLLSLLQKFVDDD